MLFSGVPIGYFYSYCLSFSCDWLLYIARQTPYLLKLLVEIKGLRQCYLPLEMIFKISSASYLEHWNSSFILIQIHGLRDVEPSACGPT